MTTPPWPPPPGSGSGITTAEKAADLKALPRSVVAEPFDHQSESPSAMGTAGLVLWIGQQADGFSQWGMAPKVRDRELRNFIPQENLLASALFTVCARNAALGWKINGADTPAEAAQEMLNNANAGAGFEDFIMRLSLDLYSCDLGAFVEFVRREDSETSPVIAVNNLDSIRCYPTGDPEFPVIYEDTHGKYHRMPWYNVVQLVEMPSAQSPGSLGAYYRIGYSAVTRALRAAQIMRSLATYNDEKIGGRFQKAVHLISGVDDRTVQDAITKAQVSADAQGLLHYMQPAIISGIDPQAAIGHEVVELASLPDGFNQKEMLEQYILALSMALGTDYQEFAPLPGGGLGTATQSETLHAKARGKGPGLFQKMMVRLFNQNGALPKGVEFEYDEPDLDADQQNAQISVLRAQRRSADIASGVLDAEAGRQIALEDGDLSQAIYDELVKRDEERQKQEEAAALEQQRLAEEQAALQVDDTGEAGKAKPNAGVDGSANGAQPSGAGQKTEGNENLKGERSFVSGEDEQGERALTTPALTRERLDYEAEQAAMIEHGLRRARNIIAAHLQGSKENPNHDERGRFTSASGGGDGDGPKASDPVTTANQPGTPDWAREVSRYIAVGLDPTIKGSDLPSLLHNMASMEAHPDITELNLDGTRLMGGDGLGIERIDMPQIPPEKRDEFLSDLARDGVRAVRERVDPTVLKPAQKDVSGSRAGAIYETFNAKHSGIPDENRILISQDNYVIDGHHTWAAAVGLHYAGVAQDMPVYRLDTGIRDALGRSLDWAKEHGYEGQAIDAKKALYDLVWAEKENPNHDDHGRFAASSGSSADVADKIAKQGGITLDVHTGSEPHSGIAVGEYPVRVASVDMKDWEHDGAKAIDDFIAKNADLLIKGDVDQSIAEIGGVPHLGAWVHEGRVIFDVTAVVPDRDKGVALGRTLKQVAVYDLASGEEISTGGAGGAALSGTKAIPAGAVLVAMVPLAKMRSSEAERAAFFKAVSKAVAAQS